jgi:hypothetical protein
MEVMIPRKEVDEFHKLILEAMRKADPTREWGVTGAAAVSLPWTMSSLWAISLLRAEFCPPSASRSLSAIATSHRFHSIRSVPSRQLSQFLPSTASTPPRLHASTPPRIHAPTPITFPTSPHPPFSCQKSTGHGFFAIGRSRTVESNRIDSRRAALRRADDPVQFEFMGAYRRGEPVSSDIDMVVWHRYVGAVLKLLATPRHCSPLLATAHRQIASFP